MPMVHVNGVDLSYDDVGRGQPVLMIMGSGSRGRVWHLHQVPALVDAGYRVITFDSRGIAPSSTPAEDMTLDDLVADTAALIESLKVAPCHLVGVSMGAFVVQELLFSHSHLVSRAVLMATRGRTDRFRAAFAAAEREMSDRCALPPSYAAVVRALHALSPRTLNDDARIGDWLELFELSGKDRAAEKAHEGLDVIANRLAAYESITTPALVIAFEDDLITPPHLGREVADALSHALYSEIPGCGHYGYLERPDLVNTVIVDYLRS